MKQLAISSFVILTVVSFAYEQLIGLPQLFFWIALLLWLHLSIWVWWIADIRDQTALGEPDEELTRWRFYAYNYPYIGKFVMYLIYKYRK
jgi:hypothetical protein